MIASSLSSALGTALMVARGGRMLTFRVLVLLYLIGFASSALAQSGERITDYSVAISVNKDRTVDIVETIEINVLGRTFKRGLLRDIPVRYKGRDGLTVDINLDVKSIRRNGKDEPYQLTHDGRYARLRIGSANVFLPHARHSYEIRYSVEKSIGFFEEFDEIYWNAIGTEWPFGIDKAKVSVLLPEGGRVTQYQVYTGRKGSAGKDFEITGRSERSMTFASTRRFAAREGMSVAVAWQKGLIEPPSRSERWMGAMLDNSPLAILLLFGIAQIGSLYGAWLRVGRDPEGGAIFPCYRAPGDLSPAVSSYVTGLGSFARNEQTSFMAALINLAIKGFVAIDDEGPDLTIHKTDQARQHQAARLPAGEKALYAKLFAGASTVTFADMKHSVMSDIMATFTKAVDDETDQVYFRRNSAYLFPGFLLAFAGFIGYIAASIFLAPPFTLPLIELVFAGILVAVLYGLYSVWRIIAGRAKFKSSMLVPVFLMVFFGSIIAGEWEYEGLALFSSSFAPALIIAIMALALFLFAQWMKAPTQAGSGSHGRGGGAEIVHDGHRSPAGERSRQRHARTDTQAL